MVLVIARWKAASGRREEFLALLAEVQAASRQEDGCLSYGYYASITDPLSYTAVEEWSDMQTLEAHLRTPHVARLIEALPGLVDGPLDVAVHTVAETGPLPLPR